MAFWQASDCGKGIYGAGVPLTAGLSSSRLKRAFHLELDVLVQSSASIAVWSVGQRRAPDFRALAPELESSTVSCRLPFRVTSSPFWI